MTSEQKYEGGGNNTQPNEQTVKNEGQTATQAEPTAQDATNTPSEQPDAPSAAADPALTISPQIVRGDEEPLFVPLTSYLNKVTTSRANVVAFRELLHNVFVHYVTSPEFIQRERVEGVCEISVIKSFYAGIATFVERTADYRLGSRPASDPGPLPGEAEQPDPIVDPAAYVNYGGDLFNVTDVATLQGWITALQAQNEALAIRFDNESKACQQEIEELRDKLSLEQDRLLIANRKITELESHPETSACPIRPKAQHMVIMKLHLGYASSSIAAVKLVQYALQEYYHSTLRLAFNAVAEMDYQSAHAEFENAERIMELLVELSLTITDAAVHNIAAAEGPYRSSRPNDEGYETFMANYLPGLSE